MKLHAVTSLFNPAGSARIAENYRRFARECPLPLRTVEISFDGRFISDPATSVHFHADPARHALWQKEHAINYAVRTLPPDVCAVAWMDADILYFCDDLPDEIERRLKTARVVQLFRKLWYLAEAGTIANGKPGAVAQQTCCTKQGCPGGAWAAHRETFDAMGGLYAADVIGGGDTTALQAFHGKTDCRYKGVNSGWGEHTSRWMKRAARAVDGRRGFCRTDAYHLWHGNRRDRQYNTRWQPLSDRFDPAAHLISDGPAAAWTDAAPVDIVAHVADYFPSRKDDGV